MAGCSLIITNNWQPAKLQKGIDNLAVIKTTLTLGDRTLTHKAVAIPIDEGILALSHATLPLIVEVIQSPFGRLVRYIKPDSYFYSVDGKRIRLIGRAGDISLFERKTKKRFPFALGDSDKVKIGDRVVVLGYSFTKIFNIKDGIVSSLKTPQESRLSNCFLLTVPINPGDSGSPVLAWQDNELKVVAIVNAMIKDHGMSFAIKINEVKKRIKKIQNL